MYRRRNYSIAGFILLISYGSLFLGIIASTFPWSLIPIFIYLFKPKKENKKSIKKRKNKSTSKTSVGPKRSNGENELFRLVKVVYKNKDIKRNVRPTWLEGLELDIYIPELKLAFEYQGQQHRYPVEVFGGESKFIRQQINDAKKKSICKKKGIKLIEYWFDEDLNLEELKKKLNDFRRETTTCNKCFVTLTTTGTCPFDCEPILKTSAA